MARTHWFKTWSYRLPPLFAAVLILGLGSSFWPSRSLSALPFGGRGTNVVLLVDSYASDAPEASLATSRRVQELLQFVSHLEIEPERVKTVGVSIFPQVDASGKLVGYRAVNQVVVLRPDLAAFDQLRQRAADLGVRFVELPPDQVEIPLEGTAAHWNQQWMQFG